MKRFAEIMDTVSRYGSLTQTPFARLRLFAAHIIGLDGGEFTRRGTLYPLFLQIFVVLLSAIFVWTGDCEAGLAGYRIVAYINEGGRERSERAIVRDIRPHGDSGQRIDPQILSSLILLPNTSENAEEEYVSVADKKLPEVGAGVKMNPAEEIEIAGRRFFRREFSISGEADLAFAAAAESGNLGLRSITIEGAGYAVFDAEGLSPAAGRMHLVCRALPALWRTDVSEEDLKTEIFAAWTRIP